MRTQEMHLPVAGSEQRLAQLLMRIRGEFFEMPGLRLTPAQARRLWGLELSECQHLLDTLVVTGFLKRTPDGSYQRLS